VPYISKPTKERLLVCVNASPDSAGVMSATKSIAVELDAEWFAAHVEEPKMMLMSEADHDRAVDNLRLAEQLGAETVTLRGRNIAEEIVNFARERHITRIVAGKPKGRHWKNLFSGSPVDQLVRMSGEIDVHIISGELAGAREATYHVPPQGIHWPDYGTGLLFLVLATALCFLMYPHFDLSNLIMVYLLGVMVTAIECGRGPAVLSSLLSVLAFDFLFVPPRFSFTVDEAQYVVTFIVMFLVALVISQLTTRMRSQADAARLQERQATAMHGLSRRLASTRGGETILQVAVRYLSEIFDSQVGALLPDEKGKLHEAAGNIPTILQKDIVKEMAVARSAYDTGQMAGWGAQTSPTTEVLYVPLQAADLTLGLLALRPGDPERFLLPEQMYLLGSLAKQVALALEVERLTGGAVSLATL